LCLSDIRHVGAEVMPSPRCRLGVEET
jgi:hypothetical protein